MSGDDWTPRRLADFLDRNAAERGDAEALVTEGARLTHAALRADVRVAARALVAAPSERAGRCADSRGVFEPVSPNPSLCFIAVWFTARRA